ncbi:NAD(P)-dependent oxidoreductase [Mesorhizobium sp. CA4]|uniref:NAD(P)-dependent oxidoreductase n=1 Tax=unclassified Mesorhizobium TaxID=325217 RepID=UPI00398D3594
MGFIGVQIATMLKEHGFSVSTWSRSNRSVLGIASHTTAAKLDELLSRADFVLSILPEMPSTRQLFDASKFKLFRQDCAFANSAVNQDDLLQAIARGRLHSAYLNVFETEPLPWFSPLWSNQKVVITPHAGGGLGTSEDSLVQVPSIMGVSSGTSPWKTR